MPQTPVATTGIRQRLYDDVGDTVPIAAGCLDAGHEKNVVAAHERFDPVVWQEAGHVHHIRDAETAALAFQRHAQASVTHKRQAHGHTLPPEARQGREQIGKTLFGDEAPDGQQPVYR